MAHKRSDELHLQVAQYDLGETNANLIDDTVFGALTFKSLEPDSDVSWEETPVEADVNTLREVGTVYGKQVIANGGKLSLKLNGRGIGGNGIEDGENTASVVAESHYLLESAFGILATNSAAQGGIATNEIGSSVLSGTTTAITLNTADGASFVTGNTHLGAIMIENSGDTFGEARKVVYRSGDVVSVSHAFVNADYNTATQPVFRGREYRRSFAPSPYRRPSEYRHVAFKLQDQSDTTLDMKWGFFGCLTNFMFSFANDNPLMFQFDVMSSKVVCDNALFSDLSYATWHNSPINSIEPNTYSDLVFIDPDDNITARRLTCVSGSFNLNNNLQPIKSINATQGIAGFMSFGTPTLQLRVEHDTATIRGGALDVNNLWKNNTKFPVSLQLGSIPGNACLLYIPQAQIIGLKDRVVEGGIVYHDLTLIACLPATIGTAPTNIATGNPNGGNSDVSFFLF